MSEHGESKTPVIDKHRTLSPEEIQRLLLEQSIETEIFQLDNLIFSHIIVLKHAHDINDTARNVRLFRGIQTGQSVSKQDSYALRSRETPDSDIYILEHAREAAEILTANPTYSNLLAYIDLVWPDLNDDEIGRFNQKLIQIEDRVLAGDTLRNQLVFTTFEFLGGQYTDTGLAPYTSASFDLAEAFGYSRLGLLVIDAPISKIEALYTTREVAIKGGVSTKNISAILIRGSNTKPPTEEIIRAHGLAAIDAAGTTISSNIYDPADAKAELAEIAQREVEIDKQQHVIDVEDIRVHRSNLLKRKYPDCQINDDAISEMKVAENIDVYTATKRLMFDMLTKRASELRISLELYIYKRRLNTETLQAFDEPYARDNVTDDMLKQLRDLIIRKEKSRA